MRLAVMTYEAVLLFGLLFVVSFAMLALAGWSDPLSPGQRWALQAVLFVVLGVYFVFCWVRAGQTLPMKSWRLRVVDRDGRLLTPARAALRYVLAWSLFVPGLVWAAITGARPLMSLAAIALSALAMVLLALADRNRQLPHDRLLGTRVIRE